MILTVGHSTHPIEQFLDILTAHGVALVADVRAIPKSRRNPQFGKDLLPASLKSRESDYIHFPGLGGLRHPRKDSINTAWQNASFRGYADYMQTPDFNLNLRELMELGTQRQVAIMCAEAVPWRCHRSLIADALLAHGAAAEHIMSKTSRNPHTYTPFARVEGGIVTYPGLG